MSNIAIHTENLGKRYQLGATVDFSRTFREALLGLPNHIYRLTKSKAQRLLDKNEYPKDTPKDTFWALKDINLDIQHGDVVGIIGRNGAGKSTLLKILSKITSPTTGIARINGRVGSLLEVGTGFHPELSGRENIYLNGSILGMRKAEIEKKFDEIVAFAEVEQFLETPIKRYSSGMNVRLAFAVAAHLEPEILIVDEVLAVGDAAFQKKCLGKMEDVSKEGRTVLFVSHNMGAVKNLCKTGVLLDAGKLIGSGTIEDICENYLKLNSAYNSVESIKNQICNLNEDEVFKLINIELSQNPEFVENGKPLAVDIEYLIKDDVEGLRVYIELKDYNGTIIFRSFHDDNADRKQVMKSGEYKSTLTIPSGMLSPINYLISVHSGIFNKRYTLPINGIIIPITVIHTSSYNNPYPGDKIVGQLAIILPWETTKIEEVK